MKSNLDDLDNALARIAKDLAEAQEHLRQLYIKRTRMEEELGALREDQNPLKKEEGKNEYI